MIWSEPPHVIEAFTRLYVLAGRRHDVVERAIAECEREAGKTPTYASVVANLERWADGKQS